MTARVDPGRSGGAALNAAERSRSAPLTLQLDYRYLNFGDTLRGTEIDPELDLGEIELHLLSPQLTFAFTASAALGFALPIGWVEQSAPGALASRRAGVGDAQLWLELSLLRLAQLRAPGFRLLGRVGASAPTGGYSTANLLTLTERSPGQLGEIWVNRYQTQASLGADVWALSGQLELLWQLTAELRGSAQLSAQLPLGETRDGIAWGRDERVQLGLEHRLSSLLRLGFAGAYRRHRSDLIPQPEAASSDAPAARYRGGQQLLSAELSFAAQLNQRARCGLNLSLPLWRQVGDLQLAERGSGGLSCALSWGGAPSMKRDGTRSASSQTRRRAEQG